MSELADKIAALLAKAESTTPGEAELIMEKVEELMAKYAISQAVLDAARIAQGQKVNGFTEFEFTCTGSYQHAIMNMISDIAHALGHRTHYSSYGSFLKVTIAGRADEVDRSKVLITSLQIQAARAMRADRKELVEKEPDASPKARYLRSKGFLVGFGVGVRSKLEIAKAKQLTDLDTHAPDQTPAVLNAIEVYKSALDQWYEAKHSKMKSTKFKVNAAGHASGVKAGEQADVGGVKITGSATKELNQ